MSDAPRLITLAISPFNELARWSLDRAGIPYREEPQALVWHVIASRRAGGAGTTPLLVADGEVVSESADIAEWADRNARSGGELYPDDDAEEARRLVHHFAEDLGPEARRVIWCHLVHDHAMADRYWRQGVSERQARAQRWLLRFGKVGVRRAIGLDKDHIEAAPGRVRVTFDEVAARMSDGRRYLLGERFTVADIAFASMASPAVLPPEGYPADVPSPDEFPQGVADTLHELRSHPAGQYALRLYREERRSNA